MLSDSHSNAAIASYYHDRAKEYDKVYQNPDEQDDLNTAATLFQNLFSGKTVLEVACGTGYWTEKISQTALSIHATDINASVVDIAKGKQTRDNISFEIADMYNLDTDKPYDGVFGGFIWSHILLQDLDRFLDKLQYLVAPGGTLVLIDSNPVASTPHDKRRIAQTDEMGNTYQDRVLENGAQHLVLKNFPENDFLFQKLSRIATEIRVVNLAYYWIVSGTIRNRRP